MNIAIWNAGLISKPFCQFITQINKNVNIFVICSTDYEKNAIEKELNGRIIKAISITNIYSRNTVQTRKDDLSIILKKAELNEQRYDTTIIDIIKTDRHIGRGFVKGGWYPRSSLSEDVQYIDSVNIVNNAIDFFDDFFTENKINALLLEVASLNTKVACVVARSKDIKIRIPHPSRVGEGYFFSENEFIEYPNLFLDYKKNISNLKEGVAEKEFLNGESYKLARTEISSYLEYKSLFFTLKSMANQVLVHIYKKLIGNNKYSSYYIYDRLRVVWGYYRGIKIENKKQYSKFDEYQNENYIFYPMQLEPESAVMVMTPEFDSQEHLIHLVASNLPVGWKLVIKEHPLALGTRPKGFIERTGSYPNVEFVNPHDSAMMWYKSSRAVAMINGTVGYEAAFDGIPVISFGHHNFISMLDYVFEVDSHMTAREAIFKISIKNIADKKERNLHGYALKMALKENSFTLDANSYYTNKVSINEMQYFIDQLFKRIS